MSVTQAEFRKALGCFATGVTVITVDYESEVHGMTANAFASVSLDPPMVLVCVDHRARTHAHLHSKKRFGVNVLAADQRAISEYYARATRVHQHAEKEAGAKFDRTAHGTPVLHVALADLEWDRQERRERAGAFGRKEAVAEQHAIRDLLRTSDAAGEAALRHDLGNHAADRACGRMWIRCLLSD